HSRAPPRSPTDSTTSRGSHALRSRVPHRQSLGNTWGRRPESAAGRPWTALSLSRRLPPAEPIGRRDPPGARRGVHSQGNSGKLRGVERILAIRTLEHIVHEAVEFPVSPGRLVPDAPTRHRIGPFVLDGRAQN